MYAIKILEKSRGLNLHVLGLGNGFLGMTPKQKQKRKRRKVKWTSFILKNFCASKDSIKKVKRQPIEWKKRFVNHI